MIAVGVIPVMKKKSLHMRYTKDQKKTRVDLKVMAAVAAVAAVAVAAVVAVVAAVAAVAVAVAAVVVDMKAQRMRITVQVVLLEETAVKMLPGEMAVETLLAEKVEVMAVHMKIGFPHYPLLISPLSSVSPLLISPLGLHQHFHRVSGIHLHLNPSLPKRLKVTVVQIMEQPLHP